MLPGYTSEGKHRARGCPRPYLRRTVGLKLWCVTSNPMAFGGQMGDFGIFAKCDAFFGDSGTA
jgi:hypothetical protein